MTDKPATKKSSNSGDANETLVGIVVAAHGTLGRELVKTAGLIVGDIEQIAVLSMDQTFDVELLHAEAKKVLTAVDRGKGVLILTDMFGGTPSNISLSFLEEEKVDVVTGVNLPMLIKLAHSREGKALAEVAELCRTSGREGICLASELLRG